MADMYKPESMTDEQFHKRFGHDKTKEIGADEHCAICNTKAPRELGLDHVRFDAGMKPTIEGWFLGFFPWKWPEPAVDFLREATRLCPKCGTKVCEYIAHLKRPPLNEDDLL